MTASEVYSTVDNHSGNVSEITLEQLDNLQSQSKGSGGSAAIAEAREKGWPVLSEQERSQMRTIMDHCYAEFCEYDERQPVSLWNGSCFAEVPDIELTVLMAEHNHEIIVEKVELPVFDFELDDSCLLYTSPSPRDS